MTSDYVINWTNEIKIKIIEDANCTPDKTVVDTMLSKITFYRKGNKLKSFFLNLHWTKQTKLF